MKYIFYTLFLLFVNLNATVIDFTKNSETILLESEYYVDVEALELEEIKTKAQFVKSETQHINLGFVKNQKLWVKLDFYNKEAQALTKILEIRNPLLERVTLYNSTEIDTKSIDENYKRKSINTIFEIRLEPQEQKSYYLKIENETTALRLGIYLKDKERFLSDEVAQQALIFLFFGILIMLFSYTSILFVYTKENSYLFYALYLLALMAQQTTYLGVSQMFLPAWLMYYDNLGVVFKVNLLYIAAAVFAKSFLQVKEYPKIEKIYNIIIVAAIIEMPLFGFPQFYYPEIAILTGFIFVIFNMFVGLFVLKQGYKQARFFVIGWGFLVIGFTLMIFDGLGVISVMQKAQYLIMYLTALEAILLSLAFTDRYIILKVEKENADTLLVKEYENRQELIEVKIKEQTFSLSRAVETKQTLLKELHHRTKNNLQLIISLVRMQADGSDEKFKEKLNDLQRRIDAILKTHQMLYLKDDLESVNMHQYISELYDDIVLPCPKEIVGKIEVANIFMPLREASYVGLIINELVTNSIKYVKKETIEIKIVMFEEGEKYFLNIRDNGNFKEYSNSKRDGLGIKLVKTLVENQLEGKLEIEREKGLKYIIEFDAVKK